MLLRRSLGAAAVAARTLLLTGTLVIAQFVPLLNMDQSASAALFQAYCTPDQQGDEDKSGPNDIQQGCWDYSPGITPAFASAWSWDDTSFGTDSSHACQLIDNNSNGLTDLAICASVTGTPANAPAIFYFCDDTTTITCGSPSIITVTPVVPYSCSSSTSGTNDPFSAFGEDTLVLCILNPSDFGVSASSVVIDTCSYDNAPSTTPLDCIFAAPNTATITVTKELVSPLALLDTVDLSVNGTVEAAAVGDNGTTGAVLVSSISDVTVLETPNNFIDFSGYDTEFVCTDSNNIEIASGDRTGLNSRQITFDVDEGDVIECVITNTAHTGTISVIKELNQSFGGDEQPQDFTFVIDGFGSATSFDPSGTNVVELPVGTYSVTELEANQEGYTTTYSGGCTDFVVVNEGSLDCTITNTDTPATIIVNKVVVNQFGSSASADEFEVYIDGLSVDADAFDDATSQVVYTDVSAGTHSITEVDDDAFSVSYENCQDIDVALGETVECTITNTAKPALLTIHKVLIQDNGGDMELSDFQAMVNGGDAYNFDTNGDIFMELSSGVYFVDEIETQGYTSTLGDDCGGLFGLELENGEEATCTITNDDQPAYLTIYKTIVNDNGGTLDQFVLYVSDNGATQTPFTSGIMQMLDAGTYTAGEQQVEGYVASGWSEDCATDGSITLELGQEYICRITNDDQPGTIVVHKSLTQDDGGTETYSDFEVYLNNDQSSAYTFDDASAEVEIVVDAGTHTITEADYTGYDAVFDGCEDIEVGNGQTVHCYVSNDDIEPIVDVTKDTGGSWYGGEFEFAISLDDILVEEFELTKYINTYYNSGDAEFESLQPGTVKITEYDRDGWEFEKIICTNENTNSAYESTTSEIELDLQLGDEYYCVVHNSELATVNVSKYHDLNENGIRDQGEPVLPDWDVALTPEVFNNVDHVNSAHDHLLGLPQAETTDSDGIARFNVSHGNYTVSEIMQDGWIQSGIECYVFPGDYEGSVSDLRQSSSQPFDEQFFAYPGGLTYCDIGNYKAPSVSIQKTSNVASAAKRGQEIEFTITVTVPEAEISGSLAGFFGPEYLPVTVTDYLQDEFDYVPGSFSAVSSVRGDLVAARVTTDPNYASPGSWTLTSQLSNVLLPGEVITLVYRAIVGQGTLPGTYPTTASVIGYADSALKVTAQASDDNQVQITLPAVLGASTSKKLVATGQGVNTGIIAGSTILSLAVLMAISTRAKEQF